jgi:hypothetical protein
MVAGNTKCRAPIVVTLVAHPPTVSGLV